MNVHYSTKFLEPENCKRKGPHCLAQAEDIRIIGSGRQGGGGGVRLEGIAANAKNSLVKTKIRKNFRVGGCKFPTALGPCLGMIRTSADILVDGWICRIF